MYNEASIEAVNSSRWARNPRFTRPLPETYSFAQIPQLVRSVFSGTDPEIQGMLLGPLAGSYDRVVLFFVDAFGWRFFEEYRDRYPFLRRITEEGYVNKLTSQFPSTTAAHVTTIHTGMPVGQSGIYEWDLYEPTLDAIIQPLFFSYATDDKPNTLVGKLDPRDMLPHLKSTLYEDLALHGVGGYSLGHKSYTPSPYGSVIHRGAQMLPYRSLPEALDLLTSHFLADTLPAYYCFYYGAIDHAGHHEGPTSDGFAAAVDYFMREVESRFMPALRRSKGRTLFLMTADHGQIEVSPNRISYLDLDLLEIVRHIKVGRAGNLLVPAGSPRDMFLHIKEGHIEEAVQLLSSHLEGKADVYLTTDLIAEGFFGPEPPSEMFMRRVGDLVILPYEGEQVWWWDKVGAFTRDFLGHHGGLAPAEMETLLLALSSR